MAKRHNWSRGRGWMVCVDCGCRYRTGNIVREYEQRGGTRTLTAGVCTKDAQPAETTAKQLESEER